MKVAYHGHRLLASSPFEIGRCFHKQSTFYDSKMIKLLKARYRLLRQYSKVSGEFDLEWP